jgi:sugar lactone lactonase YvrE
VPEIKAGNVFRMGNEFLWSDPSGNTFPSHRYADNMQPGKTSREFFWTARDVWGDMKLVEKGNVPVREYRAESGRIEGSIPVRVTIPADASRFTVVIEDTNGKRIRNLAGDADPVDYRVPARNKAGLQTVEVLWDGLDEKGKLVAPGTYRVRGLTHKGLGADYEMCYYNPGTPPWPTIDGRGAWGADHSAPIGVAAGGDWTFVTWPVVEGGSGIIGIDPTGQKRWDDRRGIEKATADADYVYAYVTHWYTPETIVRYGLKDGSTQPFVLNGTPRLFDLPLVEMLDDNAAGKVTGMAVNNGTLVLALSSGSLAVLDAKSAAVRKRIPVTNPGEIAFSRDGKLYGLLDGKASLINLETGAVAPIATPGLGQPGALAVDADGNLLIADLGPDSQVKAFSAAGKLVYTCGKKGGRPIRGAFDEQAMVKMSSVAVDSKGRVWVVESWNYPRRVSVWGRDGKLIRDYLGNTGYAGVSCYLHDQDASLAYCGPMEFKLDRAKNTWKLTQILWVPDETKGESFAIHTGSNTHPQRFTSSASGTPHEYLFTHEFRLDEGTGNVVYMERGGRWQPVAAVCQVGHISGDYAHGNKVLAVPAGEWAGLDPKDGVIWNDLNRDGKVQRKECTLVSPSFPIANGWGGRIGSDLSIYTDGLFRFKPASFTADGAPVYSLDTRYNLGVADNGDLVPVPGEDRLLCLSFKGYANATTLSAVNLANGQLDWTYPNPYPGVHGSHRATMPKPGLLIGPLKICGVTRIDDQVGNVFMMRGNLGQDFFMTTDGLYVGALFQDGRLPYQGLPSTEAALKGMPMESFSEGGEPFNGWFGKQNDGKVRLTMGIPRQAAMIVQVKGLESIRRFTGRDVTLAMPAIVKADADNTRRTQASAGAKRYTMQKLAVAPAIDGNPTEWRALPAIDVVRDGQPDRASIKLAYDATTLYVLATVQDSSPWKNLGKDAATLFKTGDVVDIQLSAPGAAAHREPIAGDQRLLIAPYNGKPVVVRMAPVDKTAPAELHVRFQSPVGPKAFDRVEVLGEARVAVKVDERAYTVEAAIPLAAIGLTPQSGAAVLGDAGFISSDAAGMINTARTYWANSATNLVNDLPLESWLSPASWGAFQFE